MEREVRVNARVDGEVYRRMKYALLDDNTTFSAWLRQRMDEYLAEKVPRGKGGKPRGTR